MSEQWPDFNEPVESTKFPPAKRIIYGLISLIIILGLLAPLSRPFLQGSLTRVQNFIQNNGNQTGAETVTEIVPLSDEPIESEPEPTAVIVESETVAEEEPVPDIEEEDGVSDAAANDSGVEDELPAVESADSEFPINRIVYVNPDGQIATIDPNGNDETTLTSGNQFFQFPAWSPTGEYVAAISISRSESSVYLIEDDEEVEPKQLYASGEETPFNLYWAPNGKAITFLAQNDDTPMALHLIDVDNEVKDGSQIVLNGGPLYWDWTNDSENILVHSGLNDDERMGFISPEGEMVDGNIGVPGRFQAPGISANGRFVSYAEVSSNGISEMVIVDLEGDEWFRERHNGETAMNWSPTDELLAYTSNANPDGITSVGPLRLLDPDTGEIKVLTNESVIAFFWSPNGRHIAYYTLTDNLGSQEFNAFDLQLDPKRATSAKPTAQQRPAFDLTVVDVYTGQGRVLLSGVELSTVFITQFLPFFDQYAMSHSLWSPASNALIVPYDDDGVNRIAIVSTLGGQIRELADGFVAFWSHQ